ncbi:MAG: UDP-N-acetylmuramoyl-tripeptide--D-alanyl-D-alanine ligase [Clostridia bacterium]|nr:UDP-N-acetylmuramoyl-tripeptide--D-alanyl-D-alanine ligase [Clostridia bacterium]
MWLLLTELAVALVLINLASIHYMHMLQLESYQLDGYWRHLKRTRSEWYGWTLIDAAVCLVAHIALPMLVSSFFTGERSQSTVISHLIVMAFFILYTGWNVYSEWKKPKKKPIGYTKRMKRLLAVHAGTVLVILALWALILGHEDESGLRVMYVTPYVLIAACPVLPLLSGKLAQPIEDHINAGFFVSAQSKLNARKDLIKIGITGSYGKTGTKFALATILSMKYRVLTSESSINTPMGLSKIINNHLEKSHEVFIAEMGARHVGDITELTQLVHPTVGLITSVGPQHLETFGSVSTVAKTKFELIQALPKDGFAAFASDGAWVDKMYDKASCEKLKSGMGEGDYDMWAEDIEVGSFGSRFVLKTKDGESIACETKLLGRHNISNVVLSCLVAKRLGLTMDEIAQGVGRIKPVEHRLQLIPGDLNVIDDAFNSNPVGAKEALNVLHGFPGRHLIITPGLVEMGEDEDKFNYELGRQIAASCDAAILVGPRHTKPILQGMLKEGFDEDRILTVTTLDEASQHIRDFISSGDAVLFENDLPDNYNENAKQN